MTIKVRERGTITLPAAVRKAARLDRPGSQVEVRLREDGVIELIPVITIPADQAWYWSQEWQDGEREVDEDIARGELVVTDGPDEFIASLRKGVGEAEA
jgi:AbrB family looped-hinge helix DNA binding protein